MSSGKTLSKYIFICVLWTKSKKLDMKAIRLTGRHMRILTLLIFSNVLELYFYHY